MVRAILSAKEMSVHCVNYISAICRTNALREVMNPKQNTTKAMSRAIGALIIVVIIAIAGVSAYALLGSGGSSTSTSTGSTSQTQMTTSSDQSTSSMQQSSSTMSASSSSTSSSISESMMTSQQSSIASSSSSSTCVGIAESDSNFSTLVTAIQAAGLTNTLSGTGPFTIFAPTNAAFSNLPAGVLNYLLSNKTALTQVLEYHVVSGDLNASQVISTSNLTTLEGGSLQVTDVNSTVKVGIATVTQPNVQCSNGVIHVINTVLVPPGIMNIVQTAEYYNFSTLVTAIKAANLTAALSGNSSKLTVFAPTNAAFESLPSGILNYLLSNTTALSQVLTYHVASGYLTAADIENLTSIKTLQGSSLPVNISMGRVMVGIATVTMPNIVTSNGIIHVINAVLVPGGIMNVVQTAEYYNFSTLVTAVETANLTGALSNNSSPVTVFAPTNAAFAALPNGTLSSLLANTSALTSVLTYHVVAGTYFAPQIENLTSLKTLEGQNVSITSMGGVVKVNNATVIEANIICSNGVIHVINEVLIPPS